MPNFVRRPRGRSNNPRSSGHRPKTNFRSGGSGQIVSLGDGGNNNSFSRNRNGNRGNGNAVKLFEKYKTLANDALSVGDIILAENYFQHADHYARLLPPEPAPVVKTEETEADSETIETEFQVEKDTTEENATSLKSDTPKSVSETAAAE
jgi:hypothetical protein